MRIGKMIEKGRKEKNISQEKLAEKIGITRQTLSNYENGITMPSLDQIKNICDILDMSLDEVIGINSMSSKVSKTEKLVKKQNRYTKTILITLYVIIMIFLIFIMIYYFSKHDFTKKYQTEFFCYLKNDKTIGYDISMEGKINSENDELIDNYVINACYYDGDGNAYLDIDYSDHGNPKTHPTVPHEHDIWFDDDGGFHRGRDKGINK